MTDCGCCGRPARQLRRGMCSTCYNHHTGLRPRLTRSCAGCADAPGYNPVDEVAVARACAGERLRLTWEERAAAIARLNGCGLSARAIAGRLGICHRTVVRHRARAA